MANTFQPTGQLLSAHRAGRFTVCAVALRDSSSVWGAAKLVI